MTLVVAVAWLFTALIGLAVLHRAVFAVAYLSRGRPEPEGAPVASLARFAVVIPAHDEELLIRDVIASLRAVDYPAERIDVHVIADNCSDATAARAREAGARVAERQDLERRGKGPALAWFLETQDLGDCDAVAFFDADNRVDPAFFRAMNRQLSRGARCLQGYFGQSNPEDSTLTRLMAVTFVMKNLLYNAGKARLGLSVTLMGTGMVFRREVLEQVGWQAMSIGEDLEQSFELFDHGERIRFVADALTCAQDAVDLRQGYTQRQRWATGRRELASRARARLVEGLRQRSWHDIDAGLDLLVPTYSKLLNWTLLALGIALLLGARAPGLVPVLGAALLYQLAEVAVGLRLMRADRAFVASLALAPVFLLWKGAIDLLAVFGHRRDAWTRTERVPHAAVQTEAERARAGE